MAVGAANEVATQQPLVAQLLHAAPTVAAAAAVITAASAFPLLMGEVEGDEVFGPFQPRAEALNGSLAIAGLAAALALEALRGGAPLL